MARRLTLDQEISVRFPGPVQSSFGNFIAGWTGVVPARSHKPYDAGSNPASATKGGRDKVSRDLCKVLAAGSIPALSTLEV